MTAKSKDEIRSEIRRLVAEYTQVAFPEKRFLPGETPIPVAGRVFDNADLYAIVESGLDFWLTAGRFADLFESKFAKFVGLRAARLLNSGSSANLAAISALTSPELGEKRLQPGDEVITVAAAFPTTVNPILQNGLVPVFVDIEPGTFNVDASQLEAAFSSRTKAMIFAHTLGNPFHAEAIAAFARRHDLWLVEDCCDALGSKFAGRMAGTFGDLATFSFYPAHHITMGEGGCVATNHPHLARLVESFRDWGRDCWCAPGKDSTCGQRFDRHLGSLPAGYDHKYTYSHIGYNLKITEMQASLGLSQLAKLPGFLLRRKANFAYLKAALGPVAEHLALPECASAADPAWFGFPIAVKPTARFERRELIRILEEKRIATRLLFGGNLTRQPAYLGRRFRTVGGLAATDYAMNSVFWVGIYPGLTEVMLDYVAQTILDFVKRKTS
jgi:CDP-6-deoxy-D-xylo-4-hexulose-3-dehydrase